MGVTLCTVATRFSQARRAIALIAAVVGAFTIGYIAVTSRNNPGFTYANFFSYFTILSNVLAVALFAVMAWRDPGSDRLQFLRLQDLRFQYLRGAVTLYMVITGIVYNALLADAEVGVHGWANSVVHLVLPLVIFADWLLAPPERAIAPRPTLGWLVFPLVYAGYSLIRGPIVDWYPYPFIDPRPHGYLQLAITCVLLAAVMAALAIALGWLPRITGRRVRQPVGQAPSPDPAR